MKRLFLLLLIVTFVMVASAVYAAEKASLGGNLTVKVNHVKFTDDVAEDVEVDDGVYVGLETYANIVKDLYLGLEVGFTNPEAEPDVYIPGYGIAANVDIEISYLPIELNLKYAIEPAPSFVIDLGAGISYNFGEVRLVALGEIFEDDDWLFGRQFFVDLNYNFGWALIGINGKYQITEDLYVGGLDVDINANNWRIGGQIVLIY